MLNDFRSMKGNEDIWFTKGSRSSIVPLNFHISPLKIMISLSNSQLATQEFEYKSIISQYTYKYILGALCIAKSIGEKISKRKVDG